MTEPIGRQFMRLTRYAEMGPGDEALGKPQPPLETAPAAGATIIKLTPPTALGIPPVELRDAIEQRRSLRDFRDQPLEEVELSWLLWACQGVRMVSSLATFRNVPSAGARHALDTYLLVNRVEGVTAGLYRFIAARHELELIRPDEGGAHSLKARFAHACLGQHFIASAGVVLIWAADVYRMAWRYGQRGYRYLHLDAGHICQNAALAAEAIGCGLCPVAAFDDDLLNAALGLDGCDHLALYLAAVGKR
ncbi:MAG: Nitroreductase family protein [Planctomycetes bacterium ADurb.Bin126]|nr:MAG: Nitroreductase family protein [Planctomycetes bacterium ADurb.Bin126]HOD82661.1 SagB/ThcOx family dehydrogenase [Phycisphaerae bacterium]HQL75426.1 SagB/ThcOx family dehydrogenase [Phycisphaerae bacterium]